MTTVYVIRHAEAEGNIYRRLHGQFNARVTTNGLRQIEALRQRFAEVHLDAVYASDLYRTRRTARALTEPKGLPLQLDPRLREVDAGPWEDVPFGWITEYEGDQLKYFNTEPERWYKEGAETYEAYSDRFLGALRDLAARNDGKTIALLSHGCVTAGAFHKLLGIEHNNSRCDNTGVSLFRYENGVFTPEYLFDNSHLDEAISTRARQRWWRATGKAFNLWFRDPTPADAWDPDFLPPKGHETRVAILGQTPVGYLSCDAKSISLLYLQPEYRHIRMGDQLLGEAVMALRRKGLQTAQIGVPTANVEALSFFTRHGASIEQMDDAFTVLALEVGEPG